MASVNKMNAIKAYREKYSAGLLEAKQAVELVIDTLNIKDDVPEDTESNTRWWLVYNGEVEKQDRSRSLVILAGKQTHADYGFVIAKVKGIERFTPSWDADVEL